MPGVIANVLFAEANVSFEEVIWSYKCMEGTILQQIVRQDFSGVKSSGRCLAHKESHEFLQVIARMMELGMKPMDIMVTFAYQSSISIFLLIFHVAMAKSAMGFSMISKGFEEIKE